jgi:hypothetical protein
MLRTAISATAAAGRYLRNHPHEFGRAALGAIGLRFGVPLAALSWLIRELTRDTPLGDLKITAVPPGVRLGGSFELMDTPVHASAIIFVDKVTLSGEEAFLELRFEEVLIEPQGSRKTQLSALLKTGALDLSRPGDLLANLPGIPAMIRDASDNRFTIDLMRHPAVRANASLRDVLGLLTSLVTLRAIETDRSHLDVVLRAFPRGTDEAQRRVRETVVRPSLTYARSLLP